MVEAPRKLLRKLIDRGRRANNPRLLLLAPSAYPLGGVANWLDYLVPGLENLDWDVTVGLTEGRFHRVDSYLAQHPFQNVVSVPCGSGTQQGRLNGIVSAIGRVSPDIIAFTNLPDTCLAAHRLRMKGRLSARVILVNHGLQPDLFADMRLLHDGLDAIVCTNRLAAALATELGEMAENRVFYCPYGTEVRPTKPPSTSKMRRRLRLGYVGRFEQDQKRIFDLAKLVRELDKLEIDFELILAGAGPDEGQLRSALADATADRVQFLGVIPPAKLQEGFFSRIDAVLLTSEWETGPLVVWEAMAAGVPVVTSQYVGSGREGSLIDGDNCLIFPVGDMRAAAAQITRLIDFHQVRSLTEKAFQMVAERYSKNSSIKGWHVALLKILRSPPLSLANTGNDFGSTLTPPPGRLDRMVGGVAAEHLRVALRRTYSHDEPGGEWPHTLSQVHPQSDAFWRRARQIDGRSTSAATAQTISDD